MEQEKTEILRHAGSDANIWRPAGTDYFPNVTIVVLNWNGWEDTLRCLDSLQRLTFQNRKIVIVDNGSTDDSLVRLSQAPWAKEVDLIETGENLGYAEGNNVGIRHALKAGADFVMLLNNDTIVDPDMVSELIAAAARHRQAGCFGPRLFYMDQPDKVWFDGAKWDDQKLRFLFTHQDHLEAQLPDADSDTDYVCGAALFFRAEVVRNVGLLDSRFFLVYEESDWCFRARRAGFLCKTIPSAKVWHKVGASFGSEASPLRAYFSCRNQLLWADKNLSWRSRMRLWSRTVKHLIPSFSLNQDRNISIAKRFLWAISQYCREWLGRTNNPQLLAMRIGLVDYIFRRFGDCPQKIREMSRVWIEPKNKKRGVA